MKLKSKRLSKAHRDSQTMEWCITSIHRANMCRHSGTPEVGWLIIGGVLPVLIRHRHRQLVKSGQRGVDEVFLLDDLANGGHLVDEWVCSGVQQAYKALAHENPGHDELLCVLNAATELVNLRANQVQAVPAKPKTSAPKSSRWQRWASAAAVVFTLGGAS